jgi:HSP20 family protein
MTHEDVKLEIEDNVLTVSGERAAEHTEGEQGFYRLERAFGSFSRSLTLPKGVDGDAVSASFADGVLEVRIPKPAQIKPRRVEIAVGGEDPQVLEGTAA